MQQHSHQGTDKSKSVAVSTLTWEALASRFGLKSAQGPLEALEKTRQAFESLSKKTGLAEHLTGLGASIALEVQAPAGEALSLRSARYATWNPQTQTLVAPATLDGLFSAWQIAAEGWLTSAASPSKGRAKQLLARLDKAIDSLPPAGQLERSGWIEWPLNRARHLTDSLLGEAQAADPSALGRRLTRLAQGGEKALAVGAAAAQAVEGSRLPGSQKEALAALWREACASRAGRSRFAERNRDSKRLSAFGLAAVGQDERERLKAAERAPAAADMTEMEEMLGSKKARRLPSRVQAAGTPQEAVTGAWSQPAALRARASQTFFAHERSEAARRHCELFLLPCEQEARLLAPAWAEFWKQAAPLLADAVSHRAPLPALGEADAPGSLSQWEAPEAIRAPSAQGAPAAQAPSAPKARSRAPA